jgi:hypothetical protein
VLFKVGSVDVQKIPTLSEVPARLVRVFLKCTIVQLLELLGEVRAYFRKTGQEIDEECS